MHIDKIRCPSNLWVMTEDTASKSPPCPTVYICPNGDKFIHGQRSDLLLQWRRFRFLLRQGVREQGISRKHKQTKNDHLEKVFHQCFLPWDSDAPAIPGTGACFIVLIWAIQKQKMTRAMNINVATVATMTACPMGGVNASGEASLIMV